SSFLSHFHHSSYSLILPLPFFDFYGRSCRLSLFLQPASSRAATYTVSLPDALPISQAELSDRVDRFNPIGYTAIYDALAMTMNRSEEHTSELQSRFDLVCRLLLEKKNNRTVASDRHCTRIQCLIRCDPAHLFCEWKV